MGLLFWLGHYWFKIEEDVQSLVLSFLKQLYVLLLKLHIQSINVPVWRYFIRVSSKWLLFYAAAHKASGALCFATVYMSACIFRHLKLWMICLVFNFNMICVCNFHGCFTSTSCLRSRGICVPLAHFFYFSK